MAKLRITWRKSAIGYEESQKRTITAMGFHRLNETLVLPDNRSIRGMATKVRHLVEVEELPDE